ncbi:hypothetical protein CEXT_745941 [Caerostris extrusa]|uniref:Uncharacterized protein n=1 Tax=Caerostris extrusa TaxID=172846 RepID=A0AAV4VWP6_CAEEX|nr:hypothetical protein CEXT_745941 [Caerostris extrusa]
MKNPTPHRLRGINPISRSVPEKIERGKRAVTIATYVSAAHLVANDELGDTVCYSSSSRGGNIVDINTRLKDSFHLGYKRCSWFFS